MGSEMCIRDRHILGGARKPKQIEDNAKALGVSLEEADIVQMKKDIEALL